MFMSGFPFFLFYFLHSGPDPSDNFLDNKLVFLDAGGT